MSQYFNQVTSSEEEFDDDDIEDVVEPTPPHKVLPRPPTPRPSVTPRLVFLQSSSDEEELLSSELVKKHLKRTLSVSEGRAHVPFQPPPLVRQRTIGRRMQVAGLVEETPAVGAGTISLVTPPYPPNFKEIDHGDISHLIEHAEQDEIKAKAKKSKADPNRSRNWLGTLNNYVPEDILQFEELVSAKVLTYAVVGQEVAPNTGTRHLQFQVVFKDPKNLVGAKIALGNARMHLEITKDLPASIAYCMKDGVWTAYGRPPVPPKEAGKTGGKMEQDRWAVALAACKTGNMDGVDAQIQVTQCKNLEWIRIKALRSVKLPTNDPGTKNMWLFGSTGTGKSRYARETYPEAHVKMLNKWWDGYEAQDVVILEDVDPDVCFRMAHNFKVWADLYPFPVEIKGAAMTIRPKLIVVTSNYTIDQCFPDPRSHEPLYRRFTQFEVKHGGRMIENSDPKPLFNPPKPAASAFQIYRALNEAIQREDEDAEI
jgi:hypothetical protein